MMVVKRRSFFSFFALISVGVIAGVSPAIAIPGCPLVTRHDVDLLMKNYQVTAVILAETEAIIENVEEGRWDQGAFTGAYVSTYKVHNPVLLKGHLDAEGDFPALGMVIFTASGERSADSNPTTGVRSLLAIRPSQSHPGRYEFWGNKPCN